MKIGFDKYEDFKEIMNDFAEEKPDRMLEWCRTNRSKLKKISCNIEYKVLVKLFLKLKQHTKQKEQLNFIQTQIACVVSDPEEIFSILKCVINDEQDDIEGVSSWNEISSIFCKVYFEIEGFNKNYFLENLIQV